MWRRCSRCLSCRWSSRTHSRTARQRLRCTGWCKRWRGQGWRREAACGSRFFFHLRTRGGAASAAERIVRRLASIYPTDGYNPASWPLCAQLTPHLLLRLDTDAPVTFRSAFRSAAQAKLFSRAGAYFHGRAAYSRARPLYERALAISEKALGPKHPDTATNLNNLALLLQAQGDLAGARPLYERALAIREKALGPKHPDTATSVK